MLTYEKAAELFGTRKKGSDRKPLENNTYLHQTEDGSFAVRLHVTDVVIIREDGTYTLNTGGWRTVTTKDRMNKYGPCCIYSKRGIWYARNCVYSDGLVVDAEGNGISNLDAGAEDREKKLSNEITKYIDGFCEHIKAVGIEKPGNGDCFGCLFSAVNGADIKALHPMGFDHILTHFEEKYYVPSLLLKAVVLSGGNIQVCWSYLNTHSNREHMVMDARRYLRRYFRRIRSFLLSEVPAC